jgi:hypothetical protein
MMSRYRWGQLPWRLSRSADRGDDELTSEVAKVAKVAKVASGPIGDLDPKSWRPWRAFWRP